eukprot:Phypoly_transcript_01336.p1 GENE.Phypoly_transcript_01336~~Phypoly_transcript_01336.p1  ORF type:complete len:1082 (+),score=210.12 Phypoly_transcript_01336:99-3344(+)
MSRNSHFGGIIAEEKQISGTAAGSGSSFGSYFQGVASYLPSSIKKQLHISPQTHHNYDEDHDIVLGAEFDKYETASGENRLCLMLSYNNGFQVWDLQHPDGKREVVSVRDSTPIKCIKFLPNPIGKEPPNSLLAGKRPLLGVISAEESTKFPRSQVKFYSLKANDYINLLRFRSPVYTIECNQKILLVGLRDSIYGFDLVTMERVLNVPCYPSPLNNAVLALGPRWLAYAANQTITPPIPSAISPHNTHAGPGATNYVEVAKDVATDLAKEVASGLFYLGDMGRKTVTNYLYPDDVQPGSNTTSSNLQVSAPEYKDNENAGTIIIYDIKAKKNVLHFRAHSQPLSVLRFDPSGTLLVTSSVDGHNFNVFQIGLSGMGTGAGAGSPSVAGVAQELTYRHLYKLVRGVTNATIQDICFSADSKWMAVSSTRGTTHIYAINPQGGPVNVLTHVPATNRPPDMLTPHKPDLPVPLVTLSVCNRIKTPSSTDEGSSRNVSAIGSTCRFMGISPTDERLLVLSKNGYLTLYQLIPHPPTQPELDPLCLELAISAMSEADVCRRTKWPEFRQSVKDTTDKDKEPLYPVLQEKDMKWLSNVEISTHSPHLRLLWIGCPQFSFRTYQTANSNSVPSSSSPPYRPNMPDLLSTSPPQSFFGGDHDSQSTSANPTTSSMGVLFDENAMIPTKRIDIRRHDPLPFKESLDDLHSPSSRAKNMSQADDLMKENLLDAISTPMVAEAKPTNYDNLTKHSTEFLSAKGIETLKPFATSPIVVPHNPRAASPAHVSTSPATAHASTSPARTSTSPAYTPALASTPPAYTSTTSTSSLSFHGSASTSSTIPNYYSRYTPPPTTNTSPSFTTSSPTPPRNGATSSPPVSSPIISKPPAAPPVSSSPRSTAPLSPSLSPITTTTTTSTSSPVLAATPTIPSPALCTSPIVNVMPSSPLIPSSSTSTTTPSSSSPSGTSPSPTSPSPTSPVTSSPPLSSQPPTSRTIPITPSLKPPPTSPFSISPPFPESEIEKLGKAKQTQNKKSDDEKLQNKKSDSEEEKGKKSEGEESQQTRTTKKKKKNKGKHKSTEREQTDEADLS